MIEDVAVVPELSRAVRKSENPTRFQDMYRFGLSQAAWHDEVSIVEVLVVTRCSIVLEQGINERKCVSCRIWMSQWMRPSALVVQVNDRAQWRRGVDTVRPCLAESVAERYAHNKSPRAVECFAAAGDGAFS